MAIKITDNQMEIMLNIIGAVESGGQVYGKRRYDAYAEAYANTSTEVSITIGAFQEYYWHAKDLLKEILNNYPVVFRKYDNAKIEEDLKISDWKGYSPSKTSLKAKAIINIINSAEGRKIQDERAKRLIQTYVDYAETLGVTNIDSLLMCANFVHQGGKSACKRIISKTKKPYTLDNIYAACQTDTGNQVGAYKSRQKMVYNSLKKYLSNDKNSNGGGNMAITEKTITICGHGSGAPSTKNLYSYNSKRYSSIASNGVRKGLVCVLRLKALTEEGRANFAKTYKTILGRNIYNQSLRSYVYKTYNGKYYSDCSSSICATFKKIGYNVPLLNTAGMYNSSLFEKVSVKIENGHIKNPEVLKVGDCLMYAGSDPKRPKQIGHVEAVYIIDGLSSSTSSSNSTSVISIGSNGSDVKELQENLNKLGYDCGIIDGDFRTKTDNAVRKFQKDNGLDVDGQVGNATKAKIKECLEKLNSSNSTAIISNNISKGQKWLNNNYSDIIKKATGKILEIDGCYGNHSRWAALAVWKDLMNRKYDATFTVSNQNFGDSCKIFAKNATVKQGVSGTFTYLCQFILSARGFYKENINGKCEASTVLAIKAFQKAAGLAADGECGKDTWFKLFN